MCFALGREDGSDGLLGPFLGWNRNDNLQCTVKSAHILPFASLLAIVPWGIYRKSTPSAPLFLCLLSLALALSAAASVSADLQNDRWPLDRCTRDQRLQKCDFWTGSRALKLPSFFPRTPLHLFFCVFTSCIVFSRVLLHANTRHDRLLETVCAGLAQHPHLHQGHISVGVLCCGISA